MLNSNIHIRRMRVAPASCVRFEAVIRVTDKITVFSGMTRCSSVDQYQSTRCHTPEDRDCNRHQKKTLSERVRGCSSFQRSCKTVSVTGLRPYSWYRTAQNLIAFIRRQFWIPVYFRSLLTNECDLHLHGADRTFLLYPGNNLQKYTASHPRRSWSRI
jgi:hypothetical protein